MASTTKAGGGGAATPPTVLATITAIPDQLDLSAVTLAVAVTMDGSPVTPSAVAWLVNGATTGIADATAETTTHTPTAGGVHVVTCAVTVDGIVYYAEAEVYTVGDADGYVLDWLFLPSEQADHNFLTTPTLVVDGVTITLINDATPPTVAGITSGVLTIDTVTGGGNVSKLQIAVDEPTEPDPSDVLWGVAIGATLATNLDGVFLLVGNPDESIHALVEAARTSGVQRIAVARSGSAADVDATAGGGQARQIVYRMVGKYSFQGLYLETAWSGAPPLPSAMSKHSSVPSGYYTARDVAPGSTSDPWDMATAEVAIGCRSNNGTAYTVAAIWRMSRRRS